ncbi:hypothetical protein P168DRAFT_301990 [Aspergillus campestris IBT 28561]|uniref:F-box domain-containing protein n=1 Tax=Aspergillus campestris (strain IBT 28561) TaxID=1392248 RepID=A0A2I1DAS6_ASPC2|nr:uncharacterized protein P168DRAFT_301990 [Aspergillus campestris IBT 28561]PKY06973.1 hypothetical protein P168DRAFT_301990 [Aspergillus campestris IBT 28561]
MHTALPYDCWKAIAEHLPQDDLPSLSLVSKDIRSTVEPLLYRKISWPWDEPVPTRRILRLLRTIMHRPELASQVYHLGLVSTQEVFSSEPWTPPESDIDWDTEQAEYRDVVRLAQGLVDDALFPDAGKWKQALQEGDPHAFASILLSRLHNLRSLRLDYMFVWMSGFPGLMLKHALFPTNLASSSAQTLLPDFQFLETVDYGSNARIAERIEEEIDLDTVEGYPDCEPEQFKAWFYLPSLKALAIWLRDARDIGNKSNLHQLHTLILARATISEQDVPHLLSQTTPALHTLHLGLAYHWGQDIALANGTELLRGIHSFAPSITNISLGLEYYPPTFGEYYLDNEQEETLRAPFEGFLLHMKSARKIESPVTLLVGWDSARSLDDLSAILPESVEEVCIRLDFGGVGSMDWTVVSLLEWVERHLEGLVSKCPNVRGIVLRAWAPLKVDWSEEKRVEMDGLGV